MPQIDPAIWYFGQLQTVYYGNAEWETRAFWHNQIQGLVLDTTWKL